MTDASKTDNHRILQRLKECGLRLTRNRENLVGVLARAEQPLSADELRQKAMFAETDLATVYRNLDAFQNAGILQRIPLENGSQLFELTDLDDHYHHLICRECHKTERLDICIGDKLSKQAASLGYMQIKHVLEVYGVCGDCNSQTA